MRKTNLSTYIRLFARINGGIKERIIGYSIVFTHRRPMLDPVRLSYAFIRDWRKIRVITRARTRQRASRDKWRSGRRLRRHDADATGRRERPLHHLSHGNHRTRIEIANTHVSLVRAPCPMRVTSGSTAASPYLIPAIRVCGGHVSTSRVHETRVQNMNIVSTVLQRQENEKLYYRWILSCMRSYI